MRALLKFLIPLCAAAAVGAGCSLLVHFDPEGQPCDAQGGCLAGYGCVAGKCQLGVDAGTSVCGNCAAGFKCLEASRTCVPNTCQYVRCAVGSICSEDTGVPSCRPVAGTGLGSPCTQDVDCSANGANRFCLRSAISSPANNGAPRTGICVERCPTFGTTCLTTGATCKPFQLGLDAGATSLCVPENLLSSCRTDFDCIDPSFVCTVYDNPNLGPVTVCDQPLSGGAQTGAACASGRNDGGTTDPFCGNGLCVPQGSSVGGKCATLCVEGTCSTAQSCQLSELTVQSTPRFVPMCITAPSHCQTCTDDSACNPDAPHCTFNAGRNLCLAACALDAGVSFQCANGDRCQAVDAGVFRCVPQAGCP